MLTFRLILMFEIHWKESCSKFQGIVVTLILKTTMNEIFFLHVFTDVWMFTIYDVCLCLIFVSLYDVRTSLEKETNLEQPEQKFRAFKRDQADCQNEFLSQSCNSLKCWLFFIIICSDSIFDGNEHFFCLSLYFVLFLTHVIQQFNRINMNSYFDPNCLGSI